VEASEDEVAAYLDRLLDADFRLGIREQELDWDRCLQLFGQNLAVEAARRGDQEPTAGEERAQPRFAP